MSLSADEASRSSLLKDEVNPEFWVPPPAEDGEDEPSSLRSFGEGNDGCSELKEERIKAMNDVKNGKFRTFISQLVESAGVDSSGNCGDNWVDVVAALSWEAAAFVKPSPQERKAMGPNEYVKIKCIATGMRVQSKLIEGLVFGRHAAHKQMPTEYRNPRVLLIYGSLDLSSSRLSSFESMEPEMENLNSIVEMIDTYRPNVNLVEKSVSRDVQEAFLEKRITLVSDMKLHRLQRIARYLGSPILSKLRLCNSFHIKKFVEDHDVSTEDGKQPTKRLMFLEGASTCLHHTAYGS